ncbi:MAG: hypothetical protein JKY95_09415 [Planctomycetaceae bacterium]|nr:hypothetical protein [Planctomycetaceae bacterium]
MAKNRIGKRISSHPKVTPEVLAKLKEAAEEEDAYWLSSKGQAEMRKMKKAHEARKKEVKKISVRLPLAISNTLDQYSQTHDLDKATVIRLALSNQFKKKPPKKLPESVIATPGNPNIAELASQGGKAKAKKLQKKR